MSNWLDHSSILGHVGKYGQKISDPLAWVLGDKYTHLTSDVLPEKVNSGLSTVMKPFDKVDKTINPVRRIPIVNRVGDIVASKPGDAAAIAAGAYFGGEAALGAGGGGGVGGAGAGGGAGSGLADTAAFNPAVDSQLASTQLGLTAADTAPAAGAGEGSGFVFNPAQDSQLANVENNLSAVTTDDTIPQQSAPTKGLSRSNMPGQQRQKKQAQWVAGVPDADYTARSTEDTIAQSSRTVKTAAPAGALKKGLTSSHPVDVNGQHILAIRKLNDEIEAVSARIAALKKGK